MVGVSILGCPGARERDEDNTLCLDVAQEVLLRPQCRTGREGRPGVREAGEDVVASRKADRACAGGRGEWGKGGEGQLRGLQESGPCWPSGRRGVREGVPQGWAPAAGVGWVVGPCTFGPRYVSPPLAEGPGKGRLSSPSLRDPP